MLKIYFSNETLERVVIGMIDCLSDSSGGSIGEKEHGYAEYLSYIPLTVTDEHFLYDKLNLDRYEHELEGCADEFDKTPHVIHHILRMVDDIVIETTDDLREVFEVWIDRWGSEYAFDRVFPDVKNKMKIVVQEEWVEND